MVHLLKDSGRARPKLHRARGRFHIKEIEPGVGCQVFIVKTVDSGHTRDWDEPAFVKLHLHGTVHDGLGFIDRSHQKLR